MVNFAVQTRPARPQINLQCHKTFIAHMYRSSVNKVSNMTVRHRKSIKRTLSLQILPLDISGSFNYTKPRWPDRSMKRNKFPDSSTTRAPTQS